jgi:ABC-type multidrug transport system ATPase subunit
MEDWILEVNDLKKHYKTVQAVKGISFRVKRGEIFGILGPNGSGKTTTLAMLLGVLRASSGSFSWFGNGNADANRLRIGALLETPNFYPYLSATDNLKIVAKIKNVSQADKAIEKALTSVGLLERAHSKFSTFSLGMKQRLAIGAALLSDPEVLVLDEPTNGLDPLGIADIRKLIQQLAREGKTVIIASHILDEMEKICTEVVIMRHGDVLKSGRLSAIIGEKEHLFIHSNNLPAIKQTLEPHHLRILKETDQLLEFAIDLSSKQVNQLLAENQLYCDEIYVRKQSLEQAFLAIIEA